MTRPTLSRKREKGDTRLEKEKLERPPEPSSNFGQAIQEQQSVKAQELQGDKLGAQLEEKR